MKILKIEDIKISDDKKLLDAENNITPYVESLIEKIHHEIPKGKEKTLKKLIKYTNQFPKIPLFKNYLMSYYAYKDNDEKATEINKWIIREHPNYLYAKINYAIVLLEENKNKELKELLGNSLLLHELYPERKLFLPDEIISYYKMTLHYLYKNNKIEEADNRSHILEVLFEGHHKIEDLETIKRHYLFNNINLFDSFADDNDDDFIDDEIKRKRDLLQTDIAPEFNFPEQIKYFYINTTNSISKEQLNELIALNEDLLIDDLIKVMYDSINRFNYFNEGDFSEKELCFPTHAFHLLIYLRTEKALEVVFDILHQDFEYSVFWFNDLSFEYTSYFLDLYAKKYRKKLLGFIKEEYVVSINKITVLESFMKSSNFKDVKKREIVVEELNEIIDFFIVNQENPTINDFELNCFFVSELIDYGVTELLPKIKKMFDLGILVTDFLGGYNQIEKNIKKSKPDLKSFKTYNTIHDVYEDFFFDEYFDGDDFFEEEDFEENPEAVESQIKKEKIGRNDPCFCGSGKKYKKCCINL